MKTNLLLIISMYLLSGPVFAECNLDLAISAGSYINNLEKANLQRYQNNSVCEVLSYEFWNCTDKQKAKIKKSFDFKQVLGNYCGPHLRPTNISVSNGEFMKGAELYSWKDDSGYYWYALLPGTNRNKSSQELLKNKVTLGYLKEVFPLLPAGTEVSWNSLVSFSNPDKLEFLLPPEKVTAEIKKSASQTQFITK